MISIHKKVSNARSILYDVYTPGKLYDYVSFTFMSDYKYFQPKILWGFKQSGLVLYIPYHIDEFEIVRPEYV